MKWVKKENDKIARVVCSKTCPGNGFVEAKNFEGSKGTPSSWYDWDNAGKRIDDDTLISKGIRSDNRGTYYNKVTKVPLKIHKLDTDIPEGYTAEKPEGNLFESFNEETGEWEIDETKQKINELNTQIAQKKGSLSTDDYKIIKFFEKMIKSQDMKTEFDKLYPDLLDTRDTLRQDINTLESQVKELDKEVT